MNGLSLIFSCVRQEEIRLLAERRGKQKVTKRSLLTMLFTTIVFLSACGNPEPASIDNDEVEQKETNWRLFSPDGKEAIAWMRIGPGTYSGENYDKEIIIKEVEAWPEGLEVDEYFARLTALSAEDFRIYQQFLDDTEVVFSS